MVNKDFLNDILSMHRYSKRVIAVSTDIGLCVLCTWLAFVLRLEQLILFKDFNFVPAVISVVIAIPVFWLFGLYRTIFRYTGLSIVLTILISTFIYGLIYFLIVTVYGIQGFPKSIGQAVPRSIGIIQPMLLFFAIIVSRLSVKYLILNYYSYKNKVQNKKNVLIYGAGDAGRQLLIALETSSEFKVKGFLDDNHELQRQVLLGKTVYSSDNLENLLSINNISLVFLALPSISRRKRNQIIQKLNKHNLIVKTLPSVSEIVEGRITISDIKDLNIDDLLNREQVEPDDKLMKKNIESKNVIVTGAGGSIGSELCRQIIKLKPNKLLLLELNEFVLYKVYDELINYNKNIKVIPLLVNSQDQEKLEIIFETFKVDTVYHAAAYKHVPLVEENICEGVKNNVFSTLAVVKASIQKNISNLVLISSDKAVRPTNIMGATKRLSELCMQGIYNETKDININCSIVRFGNVLESSGSVIPKFKKQIRDGGPVTLTHKDVTRYFMTVTEAAQLVIQAGAMGKSSEVFLLDMGESIKINEIIKKMISLSGLTIKDESNLSGDIEIKIIGLRPGEKIYEELLIGDNPEKTFHPKIQKISDPFITFDKLEYYLNDLKILLKNNDAIKVKNLLEKLITSYRSNTEIVDHIHVEKLFYSQTKEEYFQKKNEGKKVVKIR